MNKKRQNENKKLQNIVFECPSCGPFVKAYAEVTTRCSETPFAIEILEPAEMGSYDIEVISIRPRPEGEVEKYAYCGHCGSLVGHALVNRWGISNKQEIEDKRQHLMMEKEKN
jgi:uncharacterized Zn finger protein